MSTMFESSNYFVRIKNKSGHLKITIWNNSGDKLLSDFLGPDPASQFWNKVESLTDDILIKDLKEKIAVL
ncbi:MAG: hypothetical protein QM401_11185 [Bacillota bacterium]|nr:hypothetical protein [Bacillota bacterium]HHU61449.1 hypothetical protein [Natronincola sp.]